MHALHDDAAHRVAVYILDHAARGAVATEASEVTINLVVQGKPSQFVLPAAPQSNDPDGKSSRFESADAALSDRLDAAGATGRLNVQIAGKPFSGSIDHHGHGDHLHR